MTTPFYVPPDAFHASRVVFPGDEARHAAKVLRKQPGDEVVVVDGEGGWHRVRLGHVSRRQVVGHVLQTRRNVGEPRRRVTVALGLLKKRSRFETFVEKAVELGVQRIQPLRTERTERDTIRADRLQRVAVAALKQCQRSRLPAVTSPRSLEDSLDTEATVLLCHEQTRAAPPLAEVLPAIGAQAPLCLVVGPEGGFTEAEVNNALEAGATLVSLGPRRLRAETAGIIAAGMATMVPPEETGS